MSRKETLTPQTRSAQVLPSRYDGGLRRPFNARTRERLRPGIRILDLGAGAEPAIRLDARPPRCLYIGMDRNLAELAKAPHGSYDETVVADATRFTPRLERGFDLIVSSHVLEHVRPLDGALENCYRYLRPRGALIAVFSGRFAAFAIVNRHIPRPLGEIVMERFLGRDPETIFPALYDRTYYSALSRLLDKWSRWQITPLYLGAGYFAFSGLLCKTYLAFENWAAQSGRPNLATYYILEAER
jgi:SAM-dependent methyltransferase